MIINNYVLAYEGKYLYVFEWQVISENIKRHIYFYILLHWLDWLVYTNLPEEFSLLSKSVDMIGTFES
jgi:hypothetical protein